MREVSGQGAALMLDAVREINPGLLSDHAVRMGPFGSSENLIEK
jgi:hypothetical protein